MPTNAYHKGHLHEHLVRSSRGPSVREMAERDQIKAISAAHPDWPICPVCTWPIHPAALEGGYSTHPACDPTALESP